MKLRTGDEVIVLTGKDKGRRGEIIRVLPKQNKVIVDRINMVKRHTKPNNKIMQGGIIDKDMPIDASNVAIICSKCGPTRIGMKIENNQKVRVCCKCGGNL
jgi:large subunit ribosomal protein L24